MARARKSETAGLVSRKPVARFYYQGAHSHPIRRTVLVTEERPDVIVGYEIREGMTLRSLKAARRTIKTYRKDRIAKWGDYSRLRMTQTNVFKSPDESTLERDSITSLFGEEI